MATPLSKVVMTAVTRQQAKSSSALINVN
jgi:hypothetical protein